MRECLKKETWDDFKKAVIGALAPPKSPLALKFKLKNAQQMPLETVSEFNDRILGLAAEAFPREEDAQARDAVIKFVH